MQIVVEALTVRIDAPDALLLENRKELALGCRDSGEKTARTLVPGLGLWQTVERSAQVIGHGKQRLGKAGNRVLRGILMLALGAASDILSLGKSPQQLILLRGEFRLERDNTFFGRRLYCLRCARRFGGVRDIVVCDRRFVGRHRPAFLSRILHQSSYPIRRPITLAV